MNEKELADALAHLESGTPEQRIAACRALSGGDGPETSDRLYAAFKNDSNKTVRAAARDALGERGDRRAWYLVAEAEKRLTEPVQAAGLFINELKWGPLAVALAVVFGVAGGVLFVIGLGVLSVLFGVSAAQTLGNFVLSIGGFVVGALIGAALVNWVRQSLQRASGNSLVGTLVLAVTPMSVHVFRSRGGWSSITPGRSLAVWPRQQLRARNESGFLVLALDGQERPVRLEPVQHNSAGDYKEVMRLLVPDADASLEPAASAHPTE